MGVRALFRGRLETAGRVALAAIGAVLAIGSASVRAEPSREARFQEANDLARAGDYPKAIEAFADLAASGAESPSLYWNWAQAARARGAAGEALWALLRARELEPGDPTLPRVAQEVQAELGLDAAELLPEPGAAFARFARRFGLSWIATGLLALSLAGHAAARFTRTRWAGTIAWSASALALLAAVPVLVGALARPTAVVVRKGAPLLPSASPTAEAAGTLREGEVVPILDSSRGYVRLEDSSGARGWALQEDVRRLDRPPSR